MTWLDKIKSARKIFQNTLREREQSPSPPEFDEREIFRAIIAMTEAIEEIGRHVRAPLIDWNAEHGQHPRNG